MRLSDSPPPPPPPTAATQESPTEWQDPRLPKRTSDTTKANVQNNDPYFLKGVEPYLRTIHQMYLSKWEQQQTTNSDNAAQASITASAAGDVEAANKVAGEADEQFADADTAKPNITATNNQELATKTQLDGTPGTTVTIPEADKGAGDVAKDTTGGSNGLSSGTTTQQGVDDSVGRIGDSAGTGPGDGLPPVDAGAAKPAVREGENPSGVQGNGGGRGGGASDVQERGAAASPRLSSEQVEARLALVSPDSAALERYGSRDAAIEAGYQFK
jgi:hypothetical protein